MKRTLVLRRETLTELTHGELAAVVGADSGECTQTTSRVEDCDLPTMLPHYCLTLAGPRCIF